MNNKNDRCAMSDKEYRRKLYEEDKDSYKKLRANFLYGISSNFRQIRKDSRQELEELEEETSNAIEED